MKESGGILGIVLVIVFGVIIRLACSPSVDSIIDESVRLSMLQKDGIIRSSRGVFQDLAVFRDGEGTGVVHEYKFSEDFEVDEDTFTSEAQKAAILAELKRSSEYDKLLNMFEMGIYFVYRYYDSDEELIIEVTIDGDDL